MPKVSRYISLGLCFFTRRTTTGFSKNSKRVISTSISSSSGKPPTTVAIVGAGAVGGYYGAKLWECDSYDVKFQMRGEHFSECKANGLRVSSHQGDIFIPPDELQVFTDTRDIGKVDWVVVALKSTALEAVPALISPLLDPAKTRVVAIMNGLIDDDLIQLLKQHHKEDIDDKHLRCCLGLFGGMAFICSNRLEPGSIDHSFAGKLNGGLAALSSTSTTEASLAAFEEFWKPVEKVEIAVEDSLLCGRWKKMVWNLPFSGISVAMGGITVDKIVGDPGLRELADIVMDETINVANADILRHGLDETFLLGDKEKKICFGLSDNMGPYKPSTMIDFHFRRPMEVKYLFREPIKRAKELEIAVPHLETLVTQIEAFQRFYGL